MRILATALCLVLLGPGWPSLVGAHGTRIAPVPGALGVEALYDDGRPMAFCEVEIRGPEPAEEPLRTGTTDQQGRFTFVPSGPGPWRVAVDDGLGHRAELELAGPGTQAVAGPPAGLGRIEGILIGLVGIAGLFGLWALVLHRRRS